MDVDTKHLKNQRFWLSFALLILIFVEPPSLAPHAFAGATGSNWVVVVNGESINSRSIANLYCSARNIPSRNAIVLKGVPESDQISVDQFRELILGPVLKEIETRGLAPHIQGIAYSSDFPTAISLGSDMDALQNKSPYMTSVGSINGLTYLFRFVLAKNPSYLGFESNLYCARPVKDLLRPLLASPDQAKQFSDFIAQAKHADAAAMLDNFGGTIDKNCVYPMLYLAAQQWALAGDAKQAIRHIEQSIQAGWTYRDYILNDPAFAGLLDDKDFKRITKRCSDQPSDYLASRGFDARSFYMPSTLGSSDPKQGVSYMLSTVLAVTRDLGITPTEAKKNLKTSIAADYRHPKGSFLYAKTEDVRTKTREPNFAMAISKLQTRGMKARIITQDLPPRGEECSGVMLGTPQFSWNQSGSKLLPGSIADNLTSFGGAMTTSDQTKATELIRFGAAASSGAVTEPYSIQNKFPHPMIHVHYVDGLTVAEAFYSSVLCPYQLLIIGDPLCQPYCNPPRFTIESKSDAVLDKQPWMATLQVDESKEATEPELMQLLVNGVLRSQSPFDNQIRLLFDNSEPGAHEIRFLTKAAKPIEQRYEQSIWLSLGKENEQLTLEAPKIWKLSDDKPLVISVVHASEPVEVKILHDFEEVGTVPVGQTSLTLSPNQVGYGPVRLQAERKLTNGKAVRSLPIVIQMDP